MEELRPVELHTKIAAYLSGLILFADLHSCVTELRLFHPRISQFPVLALNQLKEHNMDQDGLFLAFARATIFYFGFALLEDGNSRVMRTRAKAQDARCLNQDARAGQNIDHQFPGASQTNLTLVVKNLLADATPKFDFMKYYYPGGGGGAGTLSTFDFSNLQRRPELRSSHAHPLPAIVKWSWKRHLHACYTGLTCGRFHQVGCLIFSRKESSGPASMGPNRSKPKGPFGLSHRRNHDSLLQSVRSPGGAKMPSTWAHAEGTLGDSERAIDSSLLSEIFSHDPIPVGEVSCSLPARIYHSITRETEKQRKKKKEFTPPVLNWELHLLVFMLEIELGACRRVGMYWGELITGAVWLVAGMALRGYIWAPSHVYSVDGMNTHLYTGSLSLAHLGWNTESDTTMLYDDQDQLIKESIFASYATRLLSMLFPSHWEVEFGLFIAYAK
ncbi:uncharacterized protein CLUP02_00880 [Colletotrichum lupini]|uniref:Uncharacterized protein n=1 Tax=Colletotrichum lupini TaxID=145971 RepID=A0A9Q8SB87_9PEZI|nr:uncharacterized protein CLUP02_00880 [Colletotrichum lupini]UQC74232.1 hypothetical protein CLUP02_00880 [Colletotrichum lupini]